MILKKQRGGEPVIVDQYPNLSGEKRLTFDIETDDPDLKDLGPGPRRDGTIIGIGIGTRDTGWYLPPNEHTYGYLKSIEPEWITANGLYDFDYMQYQNIEPIVMHDVQWIESLLDENRRDSGLNYSLDSLASSHLDGRQKSVDSLKAACAERGLKGDPYKNLKNLPFEIVGGYCVDDLFLTYDLFEKRFPQLAEEDLMGIYKMELDLVPWLLWNRKKGVRIDLEKLELLSAQYRQSIAEAQEKLDKYVGRHTNVDKNDDLIHAFEKFGHPYELTEKGNPSFAAPFLLRQGHDLSKIILELRGLHKVDNTYLSGMSRYIVDGRIHTEYHPLRGSDFGTRTGRFSSGRPNLQNIPKRGEKAWEIRSLFLPEKGHSWLKLDYRQEEMVIFAHYSNDKKLIRLYNENEKLDIYKMFAMAALNKKEEAITEKIRSQFKTIALGRLYRMGTDRLGRDLGIITERHPGNDKIDAFWDNKYGKTNTDLSEYDSYFKQYYKAWIIGNSFNKRLPAMNRIAKKAAEIAEKRGYVKTLFGRRRRLTDKRWSYKAFNAVDQGTAGDIVKKGIANLWQAGHRVALTVHDENNFSWNGDMSTVQEIKEIMENVVKLKVPLRVDIENGSNWGELGRIGGD